LNRREVRFFRDIFKTAQTFSNQVCRLLLIFFWGASHQRRSGNNQPKSTMETYQRRVHSKSLVINNPLWRVPQAAAVNHGDIVRAMRRCKDVTKILPDGCCAIPACATCAPHGKIPFDHPSEAQCIGPGSSLPPLAVLPVWAWVSAQPLVKKSVKFFAIARFARKWW
jgi:hypothetical protein